MQKRSYIHYSRWNRPTSHLHTDKFRAELFISSHRRLLFILLHYNSTHLFITECGIKKTNAKSTHWVQNLCELQTDSRYVFRRIRHIIVNKFNTKSSLFIYIAHKLTRNRTHNNAQHAIAYNRTRFFIARLWSEYDMTSKKKIFCFYIK